MCRSRMLRTHWELLCHLKPGLSAVEYLYARHMINIFTGFDTEVGSLQDFTRGSRKLTMSHY